MLSDCCNLGGSSRDILPTLIKVTFRPHPPHYCSFTAVIRDKHDDRDGPKFSFRQLARLIENIGHAGKIDDFTIKPIQQYLFLLTGFSRTAAKAGRIHGDATCTRLQHDRAIDGRTIALRESELLSSEDDDGLNDSDPNSSSNDDGCPSEDEQRRPSTRKHSPWLTLDEQCLLAYKKEGKSWRWIFRKFPTRTPAAVHTRWTMVRARVE